MTEIKNNRISDALRERMTSMRQIKIDVGSGDHNIRQPLNEWIRVDGCDGINVDIVCDFGSIPLPDSIADEIWSGDSIEHIEPENYNKVVGEWARILKIGGEFKGSTPNLHSIMMRYASGEMSIKHAREALYGWNDSKWQRHYNTFTIESLTELLSSLGFGEFDFSESPPQERNDPQNAWWIVWKCKKIR